MPFYRLASREVEWVRCGKARRLLLDYCEGRLPRAQARGVAEHLGACGECAHAADDLAQAGRWTKIALRPEPRAGFVQRVMARIEAGAGPVPAPRRSWRFALATAGLAVVLLAGGLVGYHRLRTPAAQPNDLAAFVGFCVSNHSALPEAEALAGAEELVVPAAYEDEGNP